jgi:hypothetical protein
MSNSPKYSTTMTLPKGGKQAWTNIMQGHAQPPVPEELNVGSPIVMAYAVFEDGTWVAGGVYKGTDPTDYNVKFMWVFDANGNQYPGWPIDVSDNEDFLQTGYYFSLTEGVDDEYLLNIVEAQS